MLVSCGEMFSPSFSSSLRVASMSFKILQASSPPVIFTGFFWRLLFRHKDSHIRVCFLIDFGCFWGPNFFKHFLRFMDLSSSSGLSSSSEDDDSESASTLLSSLVSEEMFVKTSDLHTYSYLWWFSSPLQEAQHWKASFFDQGANVWNQLPFEIRQARSLENFHNSLKTSINKRF